MHELYRKKSCINRSCQFVTNGRGAIMLVCIIGRWQEPTGITPRARLVRFSARLGSHMGYRPAGARLRWCSARSFGCMDQQSLATCNTCLVARIARKHRCFSALLALPATRTSQVAGKWISFSFPGSQAGGG